jgi:hypothetical protein
MSKMDLRISNLIIDSIELKGKADLIKTNSFYYDKLPIKFENSVIKNCSTVLGGIIRLLHGS